MVASILLTIAGWLIEAGVTYCLYRVVARRLPALLYRVLLTWVFLQVINSLAALTTWFIFEDNLSLLTFYLVFIVFTCPFAFWAFFDKRRTVPFLGKKESITGNEKFFLYSFGILFLVLLIASVRNGFMPMWGNVDMANHTNMINAFHAKLMQGWTADAPFIVQASAAMREGIYNWGYCFGYNFLTALISRLTFIPTIYLINITTCFNMALWLSAPLLLTEWKKARIWAILYWVWIAFSTSEWYGAVDRGWLTSIYSIGQCVIILATLFYIHRQEDRSPALLYVSIGLGSFMVANAHPYNYPIFLLSVIMIALFTGERRFGKRILRALRYGCISLVMLLPLLMESAFKNVGQQIWEKVSSGDFAALLKIRDFDMLTSAKAPVWLGVAGAIVGIAVVLIVVRSVKKSYIVGISTVITVVGLYAVYGGGGYLYQKEAFLAPPLFFMLALQIIYDIWQLVYHKWCIKNARHDTVQWQSYVVVPILIAALIATDQINLTAGFAQIQDRFVHVEPMAEPDTYQAAKVLSGIIVEENRANQCPINFRELDGARKMFCARITRQDDLAQEAPGLPYYAVEPTSYEQLIQYIDMTPVKKKANWETGWYLVHDKQEEAWPGYRTLMALMSGAEYVYASGDTVVTRMQLKKDVESAYIPFVSGYREVHIERTNLSAVQNKELGWVAVPAAIESPAMMAMDNPLEDTDGDLLFLFRGAVVDQGSVTLRIKNGYGVETAHSVLPSFSGMVSVTIPREDVAQGAACIEIEIGPGNIQAPALLQWVRIYSIPD